MGKDFTKIKNILFVCNGSSCLKNGAEENSDAIKSCSKEHKIQDEIHTIRTRCCGLCEHGPVIFMQPDNIWYKEVGKKAARKIITEHIMNNEILEKHILYLNSKKLK